MGQVIKCMSLSLLPVLYATFNRDVFIMQIMQTTFLTLFRLGYVLDRTTVKETREYAKENALSETEKIFSKLPRTSDGMIGFQKQKLPSRFIPFYA